MSSSLESHRDLIIELWDSRRLSEEEIASHLQEQEGLRTTLFEVHTYLEQWNLIPAPSPTYSYAEDATTASQHEQQQYFIPPQGSSSQQTSYYQTSFYQNPPYQNPSYQQPRMFLDNINTGPSPLEMYTQDEQTHERLAVRLSSLRNTSNRSNHSSRKVEKEKDKGKKKRGSGKNGNGSGSGEVRHPPSDNRGKASGAGGARRSK